MQHFVVCLLSAALVAGCAFNQYQDDISNNQYFKTKTHADANAAYVGEWTAATNIGIRSIKIKEDGRIKVCLASSSGTEDGKIYMDNGKPAIIIRTGAKVTIVSGALIGAAIALLVMRMRRKRAACSEADDEDYCYDGGDLFV